MMYDMLDKLIFEKIKYFGEDGATLVIIAYNNLVSEECKRIAKENGRERSRIIDGRLTALKKKKLIKFNRYARVWITV